MAVGANAAQAATVSLDESSAFRVEAQPGEVNEVVLDLTYSTGVHTMTVSDGATPPVAGAGCDLVASEVVCTSSSLRRVIVVVGDQTDSLDAISKSAGVSILAELGAGDDEAIFGPESSICARAANRGSGICRIYGGSGEDRIVMPDNDPVDNSFGWGGGGDDVLVGGSGFNILNGQGGDDVYHGGITMDFMGSEPDPGSDQLFGGPGEDNLRERAGSDVVRGGSGDDQIITFPGGPLADDELRGGPGEDYYFRYCGNCQISLDHTANDGSLNGDENDLVVAELFETARDVPLGEPGPYERLGDGADRLTGDQGDNFIAGGEGPDLIDGRRGRDKLLGVEGDDVLKAADGEKDQVACGAGDDIAVVDPIDAVRGNCEDVRKPGAA